MPKTASKVILIKDFISADLALRRSANRLFNHIRSIPEKKIIVDFVGIRSITRSFAHQYILRKDKSKKTIKQIHIPRKVKAMFDIVQKPVAEPVARITSSESVESLPLSADSLRF